MSPTVLARGQETLLTVAKVSNEILKLDIPSILNTDKKNVRGYNNVNWEVSLQQYQPVSESTSISTDKLVYNSTNWWVSLQQYQLSHFFMCHLIIPIFLISLS